MTDHHLPNDPSPDVMTAAAQGRLRAIIERAERLEADKAAVMGDLKEVFSEARNNGYCVKTLKKIVARRKKGVQKAQEEEAMLDLYLAAIGGE